MTTLLKQLREELGVEKRRTVDFDWHGFSWRMRELGHREIRAINTLILRSVQQSVEPAPGDDIPAPLDGPEEPAAAPEDVTGATVADYYQDLLQFAVCYALVGCAEHGETPKPFPQVFEKDGPAGFDLDPEAVERYREDLHTLLYPTMAYQVMIDRLLDLHPDVMTVLLRTGLVNRGEVVRLAEDDAGPLETPSSEMSS